MRRPAVLVVLCATLLTSCSSDAGGPEALPTLGPITSASASAQPAPDALAVPPAAQESTPEGAASFARFFYAEVTRGYAEKDPEVLRRVSAPNCSACERFMASMTALRDAGETVTPVVYDIVSAEAPGFDGPMARVDVIYNSPEIVRRDRAGTVMRTEPAVTNFQEQLTLVPGPSGWLVQSVQEV